MLHSVRDYLGRCSFFRPPVRRVRPLPPPPPPGHQSMWAAIYHIANSEGPPTGIPEDLTPVSRPGCVPPPGKCMSHSLGVCPGLTLYHPKKARFLVDKRLSGPFGGCGKYLLIFIFPENCLWKHTADTGVHIPAYWPFHWPTIQRKRPA